MDGEQRMTRRLQAMHALCGQAELVAAGVESLPAARTDVSTHVVQMGQMQGLGPESALSLLWPDDGQCTRVYKTAGLNGEAGRVLVQVDGMDPWWAQAKPEFALPESTEEDSLFEGVLYVDRQGIERLGLFDCLRVGGFDTSTQSALARHTRVAELFHGAPVTRTGHHWAGEAAACVSLLQPGAQQGLPFAADRVEVML